MQLLGRKLQLQARAAPRQLVFANQQRIKIEALDTHNLIFYIKKIYNPQTI
jgi:hypothetical protein